MKKCCLALAAIVCCVTALQAQWDSTAATVNNPLATTALNDYRVYTCVDTEEGIIAAWGAADDGGASKAIYCQHKNALGVNGWGSTSNPLQLAAANSSVYGLTVADIKSDERGGAYISWWQIDGDTTASVWLQHVNKNGELLFGPQGVRVTPANGRYAYGGRLCYTPVPGGGGVIISWTELAQPADSLLPTYLQVLAQRYSATGVAQWGTGVQVSTAAGFRTDAGVASDSHYGAIVVFTDSRNSEFDETGFADNVDIYAQRLDSSGQRLWGEGGMPVATAAHNQLVMEGRSGDPDLSASVLADSTIEGGVMLVYEDYLPDGSFNRLYAQRLDINGNRVWDTSGIPITSGLATKRIGYSQGITRRNPGGLYLGWCEADINNGTGYLYTQYIDGSGAKQWGDSGLLVDEMPNTGEYGNGTFTVDLFGYCTVTWINTSYVLKAQKINTQGQLLWPAGGVDVCSNPESIPKMPAITYGGMNNTIIAWTDQRNYAGNLNDLYAANLNTNTGRLNAVIFYNTVANGNWNNPAVWAGGVVPPPGANVIIQNAITVNVNVVCNTLRVEPGGSVTVSTGRNLTVLH